MTKKTRLQYPGEFKAEAINMIRERAMLSPSLLGGWVLIAAC